MLDEKIRDALMKKAVGFESDEVIEEYTTDENGATVLSKRKITKKYNPPDIVALRFLLEQDSTFDDEISRMTDEELLKERDRLLQQLFEKEKKDENADV